jgi:MFS family permease
MLACALTVTPVVFVSQVSNLWLAVALIGLAAASHQGFSANIFTTVSDMFPRKAVGSVVGIGGMAGAMGGATLAVATGYILDRTGGNYMIMFLIAGFAYLFALMIIHTLAPRLAPVDETQINKVRPLSVGAILGFGFVGLLFGSFGGWVTGLLLKIAGQMLLRYMVSGAAIGAFIGAACGIIICTLLARTNIRQVA